MVNLIADETHQNPHIVYLFQIPGADTAAIAAIAIADQTNGGRLCGRALASTDSAVTDAASIVVGTVCGKYI